MEGLTGKKQLSCFKLKASTYTLTSIQLLNIDFTCFSEQLQQKIQQAPKFFNNIPIIIDLRTIADQNVQIDFIWLVKQCRIHNLIPVGVRGGLAYHHAAAQIAGLAIFPETKINETTQYPSNKPESKTKIFRQPIRSGQQVYAQGGDLIVLGTVSAGAEVLADGNIHIYGTLRGRALAGVQGDKNVQIFCNSLEAELISIAGVYWVSETLKDKGWQKRVRVYLESENLRIVSL